MIERLCFGEVPRKHHIALRDENGGLRWEHCITQAGFDGPYTIAYHTHRPHEQSPVEGERGFPLPVAIEKQKLIKRHFEPSSLPAKEGTQLDLRTPILFNDDVVLSTIRPTKSCDVYFVDADADTLLFIYEGSGTLRTLLGDVPFQKDDYLFVPRGLLHRFELDQEQSQYWLSMEFKGGMHILKQFRNELGQLRMDAPYSHRDFVLPEFVGPIDENIRETVVKRGDAFFRYSTPNSPLDVVGWDGTVYPWAFPILNFQPRVSSVHVPPTWHGTFASRGALVCSFVPRLIDFHPEAIPCPYPHSSVDVDEFIFYVRGNFTSRRGVGPTSISYHPAGIPHGPHPGAYEASMGHSRTEEIAVMLDCAKPLKVTTLAAQVEDSAYMASFLSK